MIDIGEETLIPLREAPKHLPSRPNGKRIHISACYRWIGRGVRGVRLESIKIGGTTYTSKEALQRFADQSSAQQHVLTSFGSITKSRQKQIEDATREVDAILSNAKSDRRLH